MWDIFVTTVNAVLPIVLLIVLGYALKRIKFLNQSFVKTGNKLVFNVCLPCMLFINIYDNMDSFADIRWDVVLYSTAAILLIFGLGLITCILTTKDNRRRGVILQCTFRSNFAIIGLSLVERLGGDTAIAGIVSAFSIPLFNILAVIALTVFAAKAEAAPSLEAANANETVGGNQESLENSEGDNCLPSRPSKLKRFSDSAVHILKGIVTNPLIIGVFLGLVFVGIREIERLACAGDVPFRLDTNLKFLYTCISDLRLIASPFALIILGGQFEFSAVKGMTKEIAVGTVWRIVLTPLIGIGLAVILSKFTPLLDFGQEVYPTLVALFATPVAVSSAIMAAQMGADEQLGTQYVVWTSIFSVATIFITVFILMSTGLIAA